ncbi:MAG TPA: carboxypeptidase regulatory-like domain-containing protein, partial [Solirubrobacterales bacterium]|nr:carboxypeptidase regulatory-like domain-containing protein [Solirubrobacterales bacterium]
VTSEPASGIYVCAYSGGEAAGHCDTTGATGEYTIVGLPTGSYAVRFEPAQGGEEQNFRIGNKNYLREFYGGASSEAGATLVASGPGVAKTDIDFAMHEGGGISGTVTGPLGAPLESVNACIVQTAEQIGERCGASDAAGDYEIEGLAPGSYTVYFWGAGLASNELTPQYFDHVSKFDEAEPVTVTGTAVTPDIDAQLSPGGRIEGKVTDSYDGTPLAGASVCAEQIGGPGGICEETRADGSYSMNLAAGSYRVRFKDGYLGEEGEVEEFVTGYFSGATDPGAATAVTVGSGATVPGIDASLQPAAIRVDKVSVATGGDGSGAVTSSPAGIDCGMTCSNDFETRKTVTLSAEASPGSTFTGWTGACSGTGPCRIRLTAAAEVAATFEPQAGGAPSGGGPSQESTPSTTVETTQTVTPQATPPRVTPKPKPKPKPKLQCKKGSKLKKSGKAERCVKAPKKHRPRKHRAPHH